MYSNFALKPKASEKTYDLAENLNTYVFEIPAEANKHSVAKAIAEQYDVKVTKVRISSVPGKAVRSYRRQGRNVFRGKRSDIRKAYVTLAEGDKLPIFSAVEETNQTDTKDKK
jgi:large subunit ribosomal protein L23